MQNKQKAKFKIGDTFTTQFDHYEEGEIVTHTIASIDFSHEEADEIVYWDNNSVYCTESELFRQKEESKGINIGQLIVQLQKLNPNKLVTIVVGDEDKNIVNTRHFELHTADNGVEYVEFFVKASLSTATALLDKSTMLPYQYNGECMDLYTLQAKLTEEGYPLADCDEMEFSEYIWARQNQNQAYFNDPLPMPSKIVGLLERYELSYRNGEIEKTVYATSESQAIEFVCEYNHNIEYWQIVD